MKPKRISIGERTVNVVDEGSGDPILFVHGFPLDHTMWVNQIESFATTNRVIAPDLPGFGASETIKPVSLQDYAEYLASVLDAIELEEPVTFCGLSMGGYIGWQFWKHFGSKLKRLVACDTRAANDTDQVARARRLAAKSVAKTGSTVVADAMVDKLFWESSEPKLKASVHQVITNTSPESIADGQIAMSQRVDATPWLTEIKIPTLFIVGEHDEITPPAEMRQNADLVKNSKFLQIDKAGHLAPLENPTDFNAGLKEFFQS